MSYRGRLLQRAFNPLYGPLVFLHEPAGVCLFGGAWHGRRVATLNLLEREEALLDLGCGRGSLLREAEHQGFFAVGLDLSKNMLKSSSDQHFKLVRASAASIPLIDASVGSVVCTYPGAWIRRPDVWEGIERVLTPGGRIVVLLGGDVRYGLKNRTRARLARLVYGKADLHAITFDPPLAHGTSISGGLEVVDDEWGTLVRWTGHRRPS